MSLADLQRYVHQLLAPTLDQEWSELHRAQEALANEEAARGFPLPTGAYTSGIRAAHEESLRRRTDAILQAVQTAYEDFGSPDDRATQEELVRIAGDLVAAQARALEQAWERRLLGSTPDAALDAGRRHFQHRVAADTVRVVNSLRNYFWQLARVPAKARKRAASPAAAAPSQVFHINAPVGSIQTGDGATANVQQQWSAGYSDDLVAAVRGLAEAIRRTEELSASERDDLLADLELTEAEIARDTPNSSRMLKWLGGVGAVVQTLGSVSPAWDLVKAAAKVAGLPLP